MSFLTEFKAFAMRGNVVDLAVAVIIGTAFGKIISVFVDGIVMPLIGLLLGGLDISGMIFKLGEASVKWGAFLQSVIDFTIIALAIFIVVKMMASMQQKKTEQAPAKSNEEILLTEIRDLLKK